MKKLFVKKHLFYLNLKRERIAMSAVKRGKDAAKIA